MGKIRQSRLTANPLAARLREVRIFRYGERGRSAFARDLGIPVTTYQHYEEGRAPPAELLVAATRVAQVSLIWLLTGEGLMTPQALDPVPPIAKSLSTIARLKTLLELHPEHLPECNWFLDLLESPGGTAVATNPPSSRRDLIPVMGSTAAGPARYWLESPESVLGPRAEQRVEELLSKRARQQGSNANQTNVGQLSSGQVSLVQYSTPDAEGFLEYLEAAATLQRHPAAVAWRIDGESMSPRYRDGDFVIVDPALPAAPAHPCVARQAGQIGVNCKLYQTDGNDVLLIPINETCPVQRVARRDLLWTHRVVASVRLGGTGADDLHSGPQ